MSILVGLTHPQHLSLMRGEEVREWGSWRIQPWWKSARSGGRVGWVLSPSHTCTHTHTHTHTYISLLFLTHLLPSSFLSPSLLPPSLPPSLTFFSLPPFSLPSPSLPPSLPLPFPHSPPEADQQTKKKEKEKKGVSVPSFSDPYQLFCLFICVWGLESLGTRLNGCIML